MQRFSFVLAGTLLSITAMSAHSQQPSQQQSQQQSQQPQTSSPAATTAKPSADARWYDLMANALNTANFEASLVYVQGDRIEPYQWGHSVDEQGRQFEWLVQMNGPGFRALRVDDIVSHYFPAATSYSIRSHSIAALIPAAFSEPFSQVSNLYRVVSVGGARILDRKAQHIRLISRDDQRYGFSLWIDREFGIPLKVLMVNRNGDIIEQLQLTNLSLRSEPAAIVDELSRIDKPPMLNELKRSEVPQSTVQPRWSPVGFELITGKHHRLALEGTPVDHFLFSDGLSEYSVYIANKQEQNAGNLTITGSQTLYSEVKGPRLITVVGQIPLEVAKQVASSVQ